MENVQVGKEYNIQHRRKGNFRVRVDAVDGDVIKATIVTGVATYLTQENRESGDEIVLDLSRPFISLTPIKT